MTGKPSQPAGFTLVEVIVSLGLFAILIVSIYGLIQQALKISNDNKLRMAAVTLADQKMERVRNMPYNQVGTLAGIVTGPIPDNETVTGSNGRFEVNTLVLYLDDTFDGTEALGTDTLPTDYKEVRIRVRYHGPFGQKDVIIYSKVAPRALESSVGGGTLEVRVINASGQPVQGADVTIKNASNTPPTNITAPTNAAGILTLYGAPPSFENYEIIVSKAGYSVSSTTARSAANPNPTLVNQTVLADQKTSVTLSIDLISTLRIRTISQSLPQNFKINNEGDFSNQLTPRIVSDNDGNLLLVWQDFRNGSNGKIYAQKYDAIGATGTKLWANDVVIGPANNSYLPDITVDSANNAYYSWYDDSNGNQDAFFTKYDTDGNPAWGGSAVVGNQAGNKDQIRPRLGISTSSDKVAIAWQDNRNTDADAFWKIYRASDRTELLNPEIRLSTTTVNDGSNQTYPSIGFDDQGFVYAVWLDDRAGNADVYAQKFDQSGTRQWAADLRINSDAGTAAQGAPVLAMSTSSLYIAWHDDRAGNLDIYMQKISDSGIKLHGSDIILNSDGGATSQYGPSLALDKASDLLYAAWTDEREGNRDVYAQKVNGSDGGKLWPSDVRANINTGASAQFNPHLSWNASEVKPFVAWQDDRAGDFDIYCSSFDQYGSVTAIPNINIRTKGSKRIGENPIILKYDKISTSDANGYITLNNMEWDLYDLAISGVTPYVVELIQPGSPITLSPNTTLEVTMTLK